VARLSRVTLPGVGDGLAFALFFLLEGRLGLLEAVVTLVLVLGIDEAVGFDWM